MTMPYSCSPPSPELYTADELVAAEALLSLHSPVVFFPRWLKKRKRSVPHDNEEEEPAKVARLSPRSPLSFAPSGGDDTPPPLNPIPPLLSFDPSGSDDTPRPLTLIPPLPPAPPLPPRPKRKVPNNNNDERCNKLAKGSEQNIAALSALELKLEQSVSEEKSRCRFLKEENAWLTQLQSQWSMAWMHQQQQLRDLFPLGLSHTVGHHHHQQQNTWPMPCLDWKPPATTEGTAALQQQRAAEYAQARKRRLERRRTKICPSPSLNMQRLR